MRLLRAPWLLPVPGDFGEAAASIQGQVFAFNTGKSRRLVPFPTAPSPFPSLSPPFFPHLPLASQLSPLLLPFSELLPNQVCFARAHQAQTLRCPGLQQRDGFLARQPSEGTEQVSDPRPEGEALGCLWDEERSSRAVGAWAAWGEVMGTGAVEVLLRRRN